MDLSIIGILAGFACLSASAGFLLRRTSPLPHSSLPLFSSPYSAPSSIALLHVILCLCHRCLFYSGGCHLLSNLRYCSSLLHIWPFAPSVIAALCCNHPLPLFTVLAHCFKTFLLQAHHCDIPILEHIASSLPPCLSPSLISCSSLTSRHRHQRFVEFYRCHLLLSLSLFSNFTSQPPSPPLIAQACPFL